MSAEEALNHPLIKKYSEEDLDEIRCSKKKRWRRQKYSVENFENDVNRRHFDHQNPSKLVALISL